MKIHLNMTKFDFNYFGTEFPLFFPPKNISALDITTNSISICKFPLVEIQAMFHVSSSFRDTLFSLQQDTVCFLKHNYKADDILHHFDASSKHSVIHSATNLVNAETP